MNGEDITKRIEELRKLKLVHEDRIQQILKIKEQRQLEDNGKQQQNKEREEQEKREREKREEDTSARCYGNPRV